MSRRLSEAQDSPLSLLLPTVPGSDCIASITANTATMETLEPFNIIYQTAEDGLGDTVKPRLMEADADLERVLVIDDRDTPLTLADERIARAIRENNARLVIIDPMQAFLGADVDMNRANEVRPIFRSLGDIAQATGALSC